MRDRVKYNEYLRVYMNKRYAVRRQKAIERLGGKCSECGSVESLHFHHLKDKKFSVAKGSSFSDERWNEEINKCVLLCEECHDSEHYKERTHGTITMYTHGKCRCDECKSCGREYSKIYRARNSTGRVASF